MGLIGTAVQISATKKENRRQRDWMERMSNTAYQRSMADMRIAGLNPILAYQKGGASTPQAGGGSLKSDIDIAGTVSSALMARANIRATNQATITSGAQATLNEQLTDTEETKQAVNRDNATNARAMAREHNARAVVTEQEAVKAGHEGKRRRNRYYGTPLGYFEDATSAFGNIFKGTGRLNR